MEPQKTSFIALGDALTRLERLLKSPMDKERGIADGTVQRFEFCIELFWKILKKLLRSEAKISALSPKEAIAKAYQLGWISNEERWLSMLDDRNNASHNYNAEMAMGIYTVIKNEYAKEMRAAYKGLQKQFPWYSK